MAMVTCRTHGSSLNVCHYAKLTTDHKRIDLTLLYDVVMPIVDLTRISQTNRWQLIFPFGTLVLNVLCLTRWH